MFGGRDPVQEVTDTKETETAERDLESHLQWEHINNADLSNPSTPAYLGEDELEDRKEAVKNLDSSGFVEKTKGIYQSAKQRITSMSWHTLSKATGIFVLGALGAATGNQAYKQLAPSMQEYKHELEERQEKAIQDAKKRITEQTKEQYQGRIQSLQEEKENLLSQNKTLSKRLNRRSGREETATTTTESIESRSTEPVRTTAKSQSSPSQSERPYSSSEGVGVAKAKELLRTKAMENSFAENMNYENTPSISYLNVRPEQLLPDHKSKPFAIEDDIIWDDPVHLKAFDRVTDGNTKIYANGTPGFPSVFDPGEHIFLTVQRRDKVTDIYQFAVEGGDSNVHDWLVNGDEANPIAHYNMRDIPRTKEMARGSDASERAFRALNTFRVKSDYTQP